MDTIAAASSTRFAGERAVSDGTIRLALNHPPPVPEIFNPLVRQAMDRVLTQFPPSDLMTTHRWMGTENDRQKGALFTGRRLGEIPDAGRVFVTHSTQAAIHMLLPALVGTSGILAMEQMSYPPIRTFAERYGIRVVDVAIDESGIEPDSFDRVCRLDRPAALYVLSTFQNPTTVTMPLARRQEIGAIARRHQVRIIEDDVYSLLAESPLPPIASFAPELAWYLLGTAKSFSAGLKLAFIVAPSAAEAERAFWPGVRATYWMASTMSAALVAELIATAGDLKILDAVKAELGARHLMLKEIFAHIPCASDPGCLHVWIPLADGKSSSALTAAILERGVQVAPSDSYARADWSPPQAIRIGIGNPSHRETLANALEAIGESLDAG